MYSSSLYKNSSIHRYYVRPPPVYYGGINWPGVTQLRLFWSQDESIEPVPVRDIYKLEFDLFQDAGIFFFFVLAIRFFLAFRLQLGVLFLFKSESQYKKKVRDKQKHLQKATASSAVLKTQSPTT